MNTISVVFGSLKINDHMLISKHIEEMQIDGDKVLIYMVSGRKITLGCTSHQSAKAFAEEILSHIRGM